MIVLGVLAFILLWTGSLAWANGDFTNDQGDDSDPTRFDR